MDSAKVEALSMTLGKEEETKKEEADDSTQGDIQPILPERRYKNTHIRFSYYGKIARTQPGEQLTFHLPDNILAFFARYSIEPPEHRSVFAHREEGERLYDFTYHVIPGTYHVRWRDILIKLEFSTEESKERERENAKIVLTWNASVNTPILVTLTSRGTKRKLEISDGDGAEHDQQGALASEWEEFFNHVMHDIEQRPRDMLEIYMWSLEWEWQVSLPQRPLSSVFVDPSVKERAVRTIREFLSADLRELKKHGINHKLTICVCGESGTGKTSLIKALASEFNAKLCILEADRALTATKLSQMQNNVIPNGWLVIEDVHHFSEADENEKEWGHLISWLDGIAYKPGVLTVMTTSKREVLPKELTRKGRIDLVLELKCSEDLMRAMFLAMLPNQGHLVDAFLDRILGTGCTSAMLQSFLFQKRKCPNILAEISDLKKQLHEHDERRINPLVDM